MLFGCDLETAGKIEKIIQYSRKDKNGTKILQSYDSDLGVKWLWDKERWAVYTKDLKGKEYILYQVETPDGGYRWVSDIDRQHIARMDNNRKTRAERTINGIEVFEEEKEEARKKKLSSDVVAISKERWRHTMGTPVFRTGIQL